jgi:two-component system, cell cycle response regulator DivK
MRGSMTRCLIVDDHRDSREGYAEYLRSAGFEVEEAADGNRAVLAVDEQMPDIVLVDLQMPGLDGVQLIKQLKSRQTFSNTPVIVISACVYPDDHQRAAEAGCDSFLEKPCLPSQVLEEVQKQLGRATLRHG